MASLSIPRRVHVIGLLGAALLISGLFFPWMITTSSAFPFQSLTSFWSLIMDQVTVIRDQLTFHGWDWSLLIGVGFYFFLLLPVLTGISLSLAGFFGNGKRVFVVFHLIFLIIGLLAFLFISYISYCLFYCGAPPTGPWAFHGTRVLGPGFCLILGGFLVSFGASIAQNRRFKRRAT